jgi:hypothetical protein
MSGFSDDAFRLEGLADADPADSLEPGGLIEVQDALYAQRCRELLPRARANAMRILERLDAEQRAAEGLQYRANSHSEDQADR